MFYSIYYTNINYRKASRYHNIVLQIIEIFNKNECPLDFVWKFPELNILKKKKTHNVNVRWTGVVACHSTFVCTVPYWHTHVGYTMLWKCVGHEMTRIVLQFGIII